MRTRTDRMGRERAVWVSTVVVLILVTYCFSPSPAAADVSSLWFAPIVLTTASPVDSGADSSDTIEVVVQVTPATAPGPFEYICWVTNNSTSYMTDFYVACVGVDDPNSFLGDAVLEGLRTVDGGGVVTYLRGSSITGWGNTKSVVQSYYAPGSTVAIPTMKIRWSVSGGNPGLAPGANLGIGLSFTSIYAPSDVAKDMTGSLAIRTCSGEVYAYGPVPYSSGAQVPEGPAVLLAISGMGFVGALRRRLR
jgi:hypothetical protein